MLDEGLYLVKGWYFATGQYIPFQDYGFLTNHMPLAFLIPGFVLRLFGASLLVGRLYGVVLGIGGLVTLWWLVRRFSGAWWASFAVGGIALNVALVRIYSLALSQVLVAALLVLILLLSLRREPRSWHIVLAGFLTGVMLMVRINMFPFAGLWLLYIFWQHSWRIGVIALGSLVTIPLLIHIVYWPNILRMWAYWIPQGLIPGLEPYYTPWDKYTGVEITANWAWLTNLDDRTWNPIISFWQGLRFNFVVMVGVLLNLLFWPKRNSWPDRFTFRTAVFLVAGYVALTLVHMWASLGGQSCHEFCFSGYMAFFSSMGLVAIAVTAPYWRKDFPAAPQIGQAVALLVVSAGFGFGASNTIGKTLAEIQIPRPGGVSFPLWGLFENKLGISYKDSRKIIPVVTGFGFALVLIVSQWFRKLRPKLPSVMNAWLVFFILGYTLSPTPLLSLGDATLQCGGNLPEAYEQLGENLSRYIHPGDLLYYHGPNSPAILLYLPGVEIFPQQLNGTFSFDDENPDANVDDLLRFGYWNEEIKQSWIGQTDYILVEERRFPEWESAVEMMNLDTIFTSDPIEPCVGNGSRQILLRVPRDVEE